MPVDEQAIRYYTVVTILFTLFGTFGGAVRLDARNDEVIQQLWWQVSLRRALCEAIAEWEGIELVEPAPIEADDEAVVRARMHQLLGDRLEDLARRGGDWAAQLRPTMALADAITNDQRLTTVRRAADLADLGACLGAAVDDVEEGKRQLEQRILTGGADGFAAQLQTLYGIAVREQIAWLPLWGADRWTEDEADDGELRVDDPALGLTPIGSPAVDVDHAEPR